MLPPADVGGFSLELKGGALAGWDQVYLYFSREKGRALPAVVLLHGAGDRAENMMEAWKRFAEQQGIVLLAPELSRDLKFEDAAPQVFRCVVEDAKQFIAIEAQRVYLFGNSMGGYLAFDGAMFESQYFAAVAVHANRIALEYEWIVTRAQRKTPIAIYIGDRDQFFRRMRCAKRETCCTKRDFPCTTWNSSIMTTTITRAPTRSTPMRGNF